ncbi:PAS domain S-box protein [Cytobacillus sp. FJAT-54145]|uniref:PAS domain S-box protein n=1 Tax=Cytobacillus spartinae TaxID=3299023 RepID=A0ABW6KEX0_9BACI
MNTEVQKQNYLVIILLWIFVGITVMNNFMFSEIEVTKEIIVVSIPPLLILSFLVYYKLFLKWIKYMTTFTILTVLFTLNLHVIDYVNLLFLLLPGIISMVYRDWKNILFAIIGGLSLFYYFTSINGKMYFTDWESTDFFFFGGFYLFFSIITISEARLTENIRKQLSKKLYDSKELQDRLSESESKYRLMVKQSTEGIYAFNPDTKKVIEASQQFCRMLGYSEEEMVNLPLNEFILHDLTSVEENISIVLNNNKHFLGERRYKCKDGKVLEVEVRATLIQSENNRYVLANIRDITEINRKSKDLMLAKNVLDHSLDGVLVTDIKGEIVHVNPAFEKITGYSFEEIKGENPRILKSDHHDDNFYIELWSEVHKNGFWEGELYNRKKNGEVFIQRTQIISIGQDNQEPVLFASIFRDITDEVEMKRMLEDSEQRYKSLFENNQGASFMIDLNGHFISVNKTAEDISGYKKADLIGTSFLTLIHKRDLEKVMKGFEKVNSGEPDNINVRLIHQKGEIVHLNIITAPIKRNGTVVGSIGIALDVTKQKIAEHQLSQSEKRYKSLIKLYPEVVFVHSRHRIEFVNDRAVALIGANTKEEIMGKSFYHFLHEEDKPKAAYYMTLAFQNDRTNSSTVELRFVKKDGRIVHTEVGVALIDYDGEPAILGIIRDITEQKNAEAKLMRANQMLEELSKLDGLTGIPNRRFYDETLEKEWKRAARDGKPLSLIMLDIDKFKVYNDTYGHKQGDECLKMVAAALKTSTYRAGDFVARYGGEEFSIILPQTDEDGAYFIAETIRAKIETLEIPNINSTVKPIVTISVGLATVIPNDHQEPKQLIELADAALYDAKNSGRNQVKRSQQGTVVS